MVAIHAWVIVRPHFYGPWRGEFGAYPLFMLGYVIALFGFPIALLLAGLGFARRNSVLTKLVLVLTFGAPIWYIALLWFLSLFW